MDDLFEGFSNKFSQKYKQDIRSKRPEFNDVGEFVSAQFSRKDPMPSYDEFEREVLKQAWDHFDKKYNRHVNNAKSLDFVESYDQFRGDQSKALKGMYQNTGYGFERQEMRSLTFHIDKDDTSSFSYELIEPLTIDKLYNVYLDNISVFNGPALSTSNNAAGINYYILKVNEININSVSTIQEANNGIIIPADSTLASTCSILKGKKFNYIGTINPTKLTTISGSIVAHSPDRTSVAALAGTGTGEGKIVVELLFIAAEKMSWK